MTGMQAMSFEFTTAGRIGFGSGIATQMAPKIAALGTTAFVVTGVTSWL